MKADVKKVSELFDQPIQYVIPQFQRDYSWNKEIHWEPLWEDVRIASDWFVNNEFPEGGSLPHFMGSLVFQKEQSDSVVIPGGMQQRDVVVDGQQRLTTIQIFVLAFVEVAVDLDRGYDVSSLRGWVTNVGFDEDWDLKILHGRLVRPTFASLVRGRFVSGGTTMFHDEGPLHACHVYFVGMLKEYLAVEDLDLGAMRFRGLVDAIGSSLEVAVLSLEPGEQPNVVFETLNGRGSQLANHELIKSTVMFQAQVVTDEKAGRACWYSFDDGWWRKSKGKVTNLDHFFHDWLVATSEKAVSEGRVPNEFRSYLAGCFSSGENMHVVFDRMNRSGKVYLDAQHGRHVAVEPYLEMILGINGAGYMPLVLWLCDSANGASQSDVAGIMECLNSYSFRRLLYDGHPSISVSVCLDIVRVAKVALSDGNDPVGAVRSLLSVISVESKDYWPSDYRLKGKLTGQDCSLVKSKPDSGLGLTVMLALENSLRARSGGKKLVKEGLFVAMVMPDDESSWDSRWPFPEGGGSDHLDVRSDAVRRLGNLVLVRGRSMDVSTPWVEKLGALDKFSFEVNKSVCEMSNWDEHGIHRRSADLSDMISELWRHG